MRKLVAITLIKIAGKCIKYGYKIDWHRAWDEQFLNKDFDV